MKKEIYKFTSQDETENWAKELALKLNPPQVIALSGDLGAGKTTFVRAFVKALPGSEAARVKSPSYSLHNTYKTSPEVHHLDLYRLSHEEQIEDLGLNEIIHSESGFVLIEWPDVIFDQLPKNKIHICFNSTGDNERVIEVVYYP